MIKEYEGLCIITYINEDGTLEPVSDKGDFVPEKRRSLPVKLYNDKKYAKKKIQMYIKHAQQYLEKWRRDRPGQKLADISRSEFEKERIHDIRYRLQMVMLDEDGDTLRGDAYNRAYRCFKILNVSEAFNMDYVNRYVDTKLILFDEIKEMTLEEQVDKFGESHEIVSVKTVPRNYPKCDVMVEYVNEDKIGDEHLGEDKRCIIAYLRNDGELEPISDKGQFIFTDHKAQQYRIYRNPEMALRKINMFVDHGWEHLVRYDLRMETYKNKKEWAHGERPRKLIDIITEQDDKKLIEKIRFNLMRDMLDETGDVIIENPKEMAYKEIIVIPVAPLLGTL